LSDLKPYNQTMIDHANTWWDAIANAIEEGYVAIDLHGQVIAWNQCALKILRVSAEQIRNPTHWKNLAPLVRMLEERQHFSGQEISLHNNKTWLKINGRHLVTDTDNGYILTFTDITKWIGTNKSLSAIISSLDDIVMEVAANGTILHVWMNKKARLTLPWKEMEGKQATGYMPESLIEEIRGLMKIVYQTGKEQITTYYDPLQQHEDIWYRARLLLSDNANNSIIISLEDVTAECKAEEELKHTKDKLEESRKVFESVFNYSPTGIGLIGPDGKWMDVNESLLHTLGYDREEMKAIDIAHIVHPDDHESAVNQITMMLNGEINTYRAERRYMHKDGHYLWVFLAASLLWNADGTPRFFIIQLVDVTELKHLNTEAQTKNIILHATSVDLRQKIKQLQEFNTIIAHNLGGPATALVAATDLLPDIGREQERNTMLQYMKATAEAILGTLKDLKLVLDLKENEEVPFSECSLKALILQQWALLKPVVEKKKAQLYTDDLQVDVIYYSKAYLENILFNLLRNALTYTRADVPPEIHISSWKEENEIVLEVRDNGMGIDLEKHGGQIFRYKKIFHRGLGGDGVGLFMIRNQIKTFGGNIKVKSEEGKGSSFFVYFNNNREPILKQDE
jgi:PAS domain S-box-containing protein